MVDEWRTSGQAAFGPEPGLEMLAPMVNPEAALEIISEMMLIQQVLYKHFVIREPGMRA